MSECDREKAGDTRLQTSVRQRRIGLASCVLVGLFLLLATYRSGPEPTADDPVYEWTAQIAGTGLGGVFKTKPEDNLALMLRGVLPPEDTRWQTVLDARAEVEIALSVAVKRQVPFGTRVRWLWIGRGWRPRVTHVALGVPSVWLRRLPQQPPAYEVRWGSSSDAAVMRGPFADFGEAKRAALSAVEDVMNRFQAGEKVEGTGVLSPAYLLGGGPA
jgi:hypothetical protein